MPISVVTWNVNSIRVRKDRLIAFLARHSPDVVCLQELKTEDAKFPLEDVKAAGYHAAIFGQKTYNGVAILSKTPIENVTCSFGDGVEDPQSRFIIGTTAGVRVASAYFPNGSEVTSPKYPYKKEWMRRLRCYLDKNEKVSDPVLLCGDYNVAPDDLDIAKPDAWRDTVLANDEIRAELENVRAWGFIDTFRTHHPEGHIYSWWDYRQLAFPKNDGLRIDHIYGTPSIAERCIAAMVDRDERKGEQPSDHAPVICTFK